MLERLQQRRRSAFLLGPGEGEALDAVRVGVLRRGEAAFRQQQLAQHVLDGRARDLAVALVSGHEPAVQVRGREQGVVVEHLLEVRDDPAVVDRVAVEAAAEQVVHAAGRHLVERLRHHGAGVVAVAPEQELQHGRVGKLRRAPPAAERGLEARAEAAHGLGEQRVGQGLLGRAERRRAADRLDELRRRRTRPRRAGRATRPRSRPAPAGSSAGRVAARAGSTCRRRRARPSGVRKTVIGQPPCPESATTASM